MHRSHPVGADRTSVGMREQVDRQRNTPPRLRWLPMPSPQLCPLPGIWPSHWTPQPPEPSKPATLLSWWPPPANPDSGC